MTRKQYSPYFNESVKWCPGFKQLFFLGCSHTSLMSAVPLWELESSLEKRIKSQRLWSKHKGRLDVFTPLHIFWSKCILKGK